MTTVEVKKVSNGYILRKTHDDTHFREKAEVGRELVFSSFDEVIGHLAYEFQAEDELGRTVSDARI